MSEASYCSPGLFVGGRWISMESRDSSAVYNPAVGRVIDRVPHATPKDLDEAVAAAAQGFSRWSKTSADDRAVILNRAAKIIRERQEASARILTLEQGKPLAESRSEIASCAAMLEWSAEEGKRVHHHVLPPRAGGERPVIRKEPVGPSAAFSPWNFPASLAARKVASALGAGCSVIVKPAEETPASFLTVARALDDAGLPKGALNVVYGNPSEISQHLIASPTIRKISFTGSTRIGKELASLAGAHAKSAIMELGGHAPVVIFDDADIELAVKLSIASKYRNAGQVCISPTRFFIQEGVYRRFVGSFREGVETLRVGDGLDPDTNMGPLANFRRLGAMERLVADALSQGAKRETGGAPLNRDGYFFQPTILTEVPDTAQIMNEEPFGPIAVINRFSTFDEAISRANATPFALGAYAFTRSAENIAAVSEALEAGMIGINGFNIVFPDSPIGGRRDSGYGSDGGRDGFDAYLMNKFINEQ